MLRSVDLGALPRFLNVNKAKLESKGISSVRARVMNLNEKNPNISHENFSAEMEKEFKKFWK